MAQPTGVNTRVPASFNSQANTTISAFQTTWVTPKVMDGVDYVSNTYPFTVFAKTWITENDLLNVCLNQGFDACCQRINGRDGTASTTAAPSTESANEMG